MSFSLQQQFTSHNGSVRPVDPSLLHSSFADGLVCGCAATKFWNPALAWCPCIGKRGFRWETVYMFKSTHKILQESGNDLNNDLSLGRDLVIRWYPSRNFSRPIKKTGRGQDKILSWYILSEMCSERDSPLKRLYRRTHAKLTRLAGSG